LDKNKKSNSETILPQLNQHDAAIPIHLSAEKLTSLLPFLLAHILAVQVFEFSSGGYKIGKIFASTYPKEKIEF
jgi:hypothetical protein